ncbi:MAG: type II toxin-antitoxin system VapC family toxin [Luteolibacter sp.]
MNYLIDTHVFLWMLAEPSRLSPAARKVIVNPRHVVHVSAVTAVEIAIKVSLGKLEAPDRLIGEIQTRGLRELPLRYQHGETLRTLPPHHADPFDRMLIAQAQNEELTIITHDEKFRSYDVNILWT